MRSILGRKSQKMGPPIPLRGVRSQRVPRERAIEFHSFAPVLARKSSGARFRLSVIMSDADKKRKGPIAALKYGSVTSRFKRGSSERLKSSDDSLGSADSSLSSSTPALHLSHFSAASATNVSSIDQGTELEKLSNKLFGAPLLAGTNFGLRIHPGSDSYVPLIVQDTIDWLAHYSTTRESRHCTPAALGIPCPVLSLCDPSIDL